MRKLLAAIFSVSIAVSVVPTLAGATATSPTWSHPFKVRGVGSLMAVSCASRNFCMAVGRGKAVAYSFRHWARPVAIDTHTSINGGLITVSCVSARFCVAGDGAGYTFVYNGGHWSPPTLATSGGLSGLSQLSCSSRTFCAALDVSRGDVLYFNGSSWSPPSPIPGASQPQYISCVPSGFCMALDGAGVEAWRLVNGQWLDAGQLSASNPPGGSEPNVASAVSCSGPLFCAALDDWGEAFTWAHQRWSRRVTFDRNLMAAPDAVSCRSRNACMAIDENGLASAWNGRTWSRAQRIDRAGTPTTDVSCGTPRFCVAVDIQGRVVVYR